MWPNYFNGNLENVVRNILCSVITFSIFQRIISIILLLNITWLSFPQIYCTCLASYTFFFTYCSTFVRDIHVGGVYFYQRKISMPKIAHSWRFCWQNLLDSKNSNLGIFIHIKFLEFGKNQLFQFMFIWWIVNSFSAVSTTTFEKWKFP